MFLQKLLAIICVLFLPRFAEAVGATIEGRLQFPDGSPFNCTTPVMINHGEFKTYSRIDGSFTFRNIPPGVHLLDVQSVTHHFGQVKIQLLEDSMDSPKCVLYAYPGATKKPVDHPISMTAYATFEYFEKRPGFSIFVILKNPMFLMMAVSVGLMVMMPKMMEGLDPEEKARLKEQMAMQQDPNKMMSNLFESFTGAAEEPASSKTKKIKK